MLHGHGDDLLQTPRINFSSNVWYGADHAKLYSHLTQHLDKIRRYPEVIPLSLIKKIASYHGIPKNNVLVTNGATEAIYLIAQTFSNANTTIINPSFSEYNDAAQLYQHKLEFIHETEFGNSAKLNAELVFICNPNNPTGNAYPNSFIEALLQKNPNTLFAIDEAYVDFTVTNCSLISSLTNYPNLIIIRSLTKTYCIPGLRLGYLLANEKLIHKIESNKMPWSVNSLAIETGNYIFDNMIQHPLPLKEWLNETKWLRNQIKNLSQFKVFQTDTTYFLCETLKSDATLLKQFLIDEMDILIRDASNFGGSTPRLFRICTQTRKENLELIQGLKKWTAHL